MRKKWQTTDKKRNEKIIKMRETGNYSYRALGKIFNLSRTRIKAIIDKEKATT